MKLFTLLLLLYSTQTFSQCDCRQMMQSAVNAIENNYADRENINKNIYYQKIARQLKNNTIKIPLREDSCLFDIYELTSSFKDKHLGFTIFREPGSYAKMIYDSITILPVFERLSKLVYNTETIEGLWQNETNEHEYLVIKDDINKCYNVVFWQSVNKSVRKGQLKGIIRQKSATKFIYQVYVNGSSAAVIPLEKRGDKLFAAATGTFHRKIKDANPLPLILTPSYDKYSDSIALLRLPGFGLDNKIKLDSILETNGKSLSQTKYLIIDLRINFGGSTNAYQSLLPWMYTNPIRIESGLYYSSPGNIALKKEFLKAKDTSTIYWRTESALIKRMENSPGKIVLDSGYYIKYDTIYKYPEKIYVLVGERCMSAGELFLITAKQSKKVVLLGENSNGVIDRADAAPAQTGCSNFALRVPIEKRVPESYKKPIDNIGIPPDIRIPENTDWMEFVLKYIKANN